MNANRPPAFPLTVFTGFLGAGKTTLLNRLLRAPELADCLVLINEFGEIGLDHLLVESVAGEAVVMTSGCLCCTIRGDLIATLEDLLRARDNGRLVFNRVVIETTGLADPAPVLHTIMYHPYLMLRFRLDGVVTLVDAMNGNASFDRHPEAVKQAAVADRLVITKTDLLSDDDPGLAALRARLGRLNPTAAQIDAAQADTAQLFNIGLYDPDKKTPDVRRWLNAEALAAHRHDEHDDHAHRHDVNRHDDKIRAVALRHLAPLPASSVDLFLELLRGAYGAHLLRVKGIVALADDPKRPLIIHGVQHVFHPPVCLEAWPDDDHATRIVFILYDFDPAIIEGIWQAIADLPRVDGADRAALTANPLQPTRSGLLG
jgi:G3E family GTPase